MGGEHRARASADSSIDSAKLNWPTIAAGVAITPVEAAFFVAVTRICCMGMLYTFRSLPGYAAETTPVSS